MKKCAMLLLLVCCPGGALNTAAAEPASKWIPATEAYFLAPLPQYIHFRAGGTLRVNPWGLGFRAVGSGDTVSRTGMFQVEQARVSGHGLQAGSFYMLDFLAGVEYRAAKKVKKPLQLTASVLADLGLADTDLFLVPVVTAGFIYRKADAPESAGGLAVTLFYRLMEIGLNNPGGGGRSALKPALGLRIGYVFPGYWGAK